ncbi:HIRAN domain-containing protein [Caulobacter sp. CCNWLY153]|uniref:HIRAN domain-containing protein n=1 Tax=unclassified Caulobacter TaxID=2648921 RepID=UPI002FF39558
MEHWIEHVGEPDRLILAWQAPVEQKDRVRWAVGELSRSPSGGQFRYFDGSEFIHLNSGRTPGDLRSAGYLGYPAFDVAHPGAFTSGVLDAFMRRIPPRTRPDFPRYLAHFRMGPTSKLSDFALLGLTEARLPGDGFSLVDPLAPEQERRDLVFEIAGHRHNVECRERLVEGVELKLVPDPANEHDANAIRIEADGELIGHVNRLQAPVVGQWLRSRDVRVWLLRLNGTPDKPRAFAFLSVRPLQNQEAA